MYRECLLLGDLHSGLSVAVSRGRLEVVVGLHRWESCAAALSLAQAL